jgi:excisionase family DNA binding protein
VLLRPLEAANALGISRSSVYELMASGDLGSITIGRSRRIPRDALKEFVADRMRARQSGESHV